MRYPCKSLNLLREQIPSPISPANNEGSLIQSLQFLHADAYLQFPVHPINDVHNCVLLPQPPGRLRVATKKGASVALREVILEMLQCLRSSFMEIKFETCTETTERKKCLRIHEASSKLKTNPSTHPKTKS